MTARLLSQNLEQAERTGHARSLLARDGARIAGWVLLRAYRAAGEPGGAPEVTAMLSSKHGVGGLSALCVDPDLRERGVGRALLAAGEAWLRERRAVRATTAYGPYHFLPGVPERSGAVSAFLERHGWSAGSTCVDLSADVSQFEAPPQVLERARRDLPAVEFRPLRAGEESRLLDFLHLEFPGTWHVLLRDLVHSGRHDDVVVAVESGQLLAFCQVHDERSPRLSGSTAWHPALGAAYGGLGPIGVAASQRKRGLGLALLCMALAHQRDRGVRRMVIDWTTLEDFYGRVGFRVWRRYRQHSRSLDPAD